MNGITPFFGDTALPQGHIAANFRPKQESVMRTSVGDAFRRPLSQLEEAVVQFVGKLVPPRPARRRSGCNEHARRLRFEPLEARLLLSSDPLAAGSTTALVASTRATGATESIVSQTVRTAASTAAPVVQLAVAPAAASVVSQGTEVWAPAPDVATVVARWVAYSGDWWDPANWDIGAVPNNNNDTTYQVDIGFAPGATIVVNENTSIDTLTNYGATIIVTSSSLTISQETHIDGAGSIQLLDSSLPPSPPFPPLSRSQLNLSGYVGLSYGDISAGDGALNLTNAEMRAVGRSHVTADNASATIAASNLFAENGGTISFGPTTTIVSTADLSNTIRANGVGSRIDLARLSLITGNVNPPDPRNHLEIMADGGGEVELGGAINGRTVIYVADAASRLDVSAVTSLQEITSHDETTVIASNGGILNFSRLGEIDRVNLQANEGGRINFPTATTYSLNEFLDWFSIEAIGAGSRVDLSNLTTLYGVDGYYGYTLYVNAETGGEVDLGGALYGDLNISLTGIGSIVNVDKVTSLKNTTITVAEDASLTLAPNWRPIWKGGNYLSGNIVNEGEFSIADGNFIEISGEGFINRGVLDPQVQSGFQFDDSLQIDDLGIITGAVGGRFEVGGSLVGNTRNADLFAPQAIVTFDGVGSTTNPQLLEAMSHDFGDSAAGFSRNFVYNAIEVSDSNPYVGTTNNYVRLVDLSDNSAGAGAEAVYTNSLFVDEHATLDLNGLHLYTRAASIVGTVVGGTITKIPDGGPISIGGPTPGAISVPGELDEWKFFAHAGQAVSVSVDTGGGPVLPKLGWAHVELVDPSGRVIGSKDSTDAYQVLTLDDVALVMDGTYRLRIEAPASRLSVTGSYLASVWNVTADLSPLLLNNQVVGQIESPYGVDRWLFSTVAGTQVRFDLVNRAHSNIVFDLTGPDGHVYFKDIGADSDPITLLSDGQYTLTAHGTGGQSGGTYAFKIDQTHVTDLAVGSFQTGQFSGSGQAELYRIDNPASGPLKVTLDDDASNNVNELYLKFGSAPTRADYDYRFTINPGSDQQIVVPQAYAGQWYALVYGDTIRTNSAYDVSAQANGVFLTAVTPDRYAADSTATLTLSGAGFDVLASFALIAADSSVHPAASITVNSPTKATADFSLNGLAPGMYTVLASKPGGVSDQLLSGFTVTAAGAGQLDIQLIVPAVLGRHATATLYVDYANIGNEAIAAPLLILYSDDPDNTDRPLLTLDASRLTAGFWTSATPAGFANSVQFLASGSSPRLLQPGEHGRVPVYYAGLQLPWNFSDMRVEFRVGVAKDDGQPVNWNVIGDSIKPDYVQADAWQAIWSNFVADVGGNWTGYINALDENAAYLGTLGVSTGEISRLLGFELRQAEGLSPIRYLASSTEAAMPAPGPDLVFSQAFAQPISRRYELGSLGRGWADNWQLSLAIESDGSVKITDMTGTPRTFQPDSRPYLVPAGMASLWIPGQTPNTTHYTGAPGDHGILNSYAGGIYTLTETDGTLYYFRADGKLGYVRDTNGNTITCTYTGALLTKLTHSSGQSLTIAYNAGGRIASVTDSDGRQSLYTYDASNQHLLSVQDNDGRVTGYHYITGQGAALEHALSQIDFGDGSHRYYTYDAQGRLASTSRDGGAEVITFSYDTAGTVTATDASGNPTKFYFDDWGTILKSTNPLGASTLLTLDADRNLSAVTDPAGNTSLFQYDSQDNLTRFTDAMGHSTNFTYTSGLNRLDKLTDANGNVTDYNYDSNGNLTSIVYADGSQEGWNYDAQGQATTWTNRRGTPVGYTYNADGQIMRKTYEDGTHVDYLYDARGNLKSASDATGTTTLTYDANDYLVRIDYPGPGGLYLAYTYDAGGRRATSTDQLGHTLNYHYDASGRLSTITDETATQIVLYQYDAVGRIALKTLGNGVYTTDEYDAAGQLLHLVNYRSDATVLSRFDYSYDSRGRRISEGTLDGVWTYSYDDIGQLTHAVFASTNPDIANQDLLYVYDAMGNRVRTVENGVTTEYTTNRLNQYTKVGNTTYTFDADGNLVLEASPSGTVRYSYDDENRLIAMQQGADAWVYTYDSFSQRVAVDHGGIVTRYTIDPIGLGNTVGVYDVAGRLIEGYNYGLGLLSRSVGQASAWYTFDGVANTSALVGFGGATLVGYSYGPFGGLIANPDIALNRFQFAAEYGMITDTSGFSFSRSRYYSSDIGRFSQSDPIGVLGEINPYRYAGNRPTSVLDVLGQSPATVEDIQRMVFRDVESARLHGKDGNIKMTWRERLSLGDNYMRCSDWAGRMNTLLTSEGGWVVSRESRPGKMPWWHLFVFTEDFGGWLKGEPFIEHFWVEITNPETGERYRVDPWEYPDKIIIEIPRTPHGGRDGSIPGSVDPNQKLGPVGSGAAGYISPSITLPYRIEFENDATATAPAQIVTITDQLDTELNWNTFALTEIAFGDKTIVVPANPQHFETTVPVTYNGRNFEVQIEAGINLATGKVFATFYSIDPATGLPPDVLTGFLPPEDGTGRGMGHVAYIVNQKSGLATGTQIKNIALISFDGQPWIATNQVDPHDPSKGTDPTKEALNTIDAGAPASAVQPLAPKRTLADFLVSWSSADDAGGSGVASQDIFVSVDGGSYSLWKGDTTATSAIFSGQAGHTYAFYSVAQDNVGNTEAAPAAPDATTQVVDGLAVSSASADASGVTVRFNRAIDPALLNLYATQTGGQGAADVTLVGAATGAVTGSLVLDADPIMGFRFVKTGAPLAADTYTLTLRSAANGFIDKATHLLDGNDDGIAGDDFVKSFTVAASGALLSIPDIARGPGQPVNQPATGSGLPVTLSNAVGATQVSFTLNFDHELLAVTGATLGSGAPAGSTISVDLSQPNKAIVTVNLGSPITSAAARELVRIQANVPLTSADKYTQKCVLDLNSVSINGGAIAVRADDGVFANAYVGDASGNRAYSTLDVQRLQRVVVRFDTGFAPYLLLDPAILGDTTGNGIFNSLDVQRLQQYVVGQPTPSIPPLPTPPPPPKTFSGADPTISVGTATTAPGGKVTVPITVDDVQGIESIQLTLAYASNLLTLNQVRQVGATADFEFQANQLTAGVLKIDVSRMAPIATKGSATLFELDFTVATNAPAGAIPIDLQWAALNDTWLMLNPAPQPGADATDGRVMVVAPSRSAKVARMPPIQLPAPALSSLLLGGGQAKEPSRPQIVVSGLESTALEELSIEQPGWIDGFVNLTGALASNELPAPNPNAGLKVTLPVVARTTPSTAGFGLSV